MDITPEIWQTVGAFTLALVLAFVRYILPALLLIAAVVMLFSKKHADRRKLLLILCAVFAVWILLAWLLP